MPKTFNRETPIIKSLEIIDTISTSDDDISDRGLDRYRDRDHQHSVYHNKQWY